jgi:formate dehydrogenase maturation protein FdhE
VPANNDRIISAMEELEKAEGDLPSLLKFYRKLIQIQDRVGQEIKMPNPVFTREAVNAHATSGKPLLSFTELAIDWPLLRKTYKEITSLFQEYSELFGSLPEQIAALPPGKIITKPHVRNWYRGNPVLPGTGSDDRTQVLITAIFSAALKPFLVKEAEAIRSLLDLEIWRRGYCPVCGGNPDFAFLAADTAARWLVCSRCDTEWLFQRLQCPYCDNSDQNKLSFLTNESGSHRLYVCDKCKHYLKAVDFRHAKKTTLIPLERLLTLDMDKQGQEKGYTPCS